MTMVNMPPTRKEETERGIRFFEGVLLFAANVLVFFLCYSLRSAWPWIYVGSLGLIIMWSNFQKKKIALGMLLFLVGALRVPFLFQYFGYGIVLYDCFLGLMIVTSGDRKNAPVVIGFLISTAFGIFALFVFAILFAMNMKC